MKNSRRDYEFNLETSKKSMFRECVNCGQEALDESRLNDKELNKRNPYFYCLECAMSYNNKSQLKIENDSSIDYNISSMNGPDPDQVQRSLNDITFKFNSQVNNIRGSKYLKSMIQDDEALTNDENLEESNENILNYSKKFRTDRTEDDDSAEINIANEVNKSESFEEYKPSSEEQKQSFTSFNSSVLKESRPRVYEYNDNLNPMKSAENDKIMKKSAEFTFRKLKAALKTSYENPTEGSSMPYYSQRSQIYPRNAESVLYESEPRNLNSQNFNGSIRSHRIQNSEISGAKDSQRGRPRSYRSDFKKCRSKSEIKKDFELMRSKLLDKESERITLEQDFQRKNAQFKSKEEKLEEILAKLRGKIHELTKVNTEKVRDICKNHESELEKYKDGYQHQLEESMKFQNERERINRKAKEKEELAKQLEKECEETQANYESRMDDIKEKINTLKKRVSEIQSKTKVTKAETTRVEKMITKLSERNYELTNQMKKTNISIEHYYNENNLLNDIVDKLKRLVQGSKSHPLESNRSSVIIEDSESLQKKVNNMKRSCSCKKIETPFDKSKQRCKSNNLYYDSSYDYHGLGSRNNKSSMMVTNLRRINESMNPKIIGLSNFNSSICNKSNIKSVKVYNFKSHDNDLQKKLKTSRKTNKISSEMFKKFLKSYKDKGRVKSRANKQGSGSLSNFFKASLKSPQGSMKIDLKCKFPKNKAHMNFFKQKMYESSLE
ncbi:unnamed protein product [Moneuplotes crassus]|uniref:Uncharacterized protein n=1 Tax=Euplotes crassus TaxID=5936 RepID=A0AAD1Y948_EUPCR|nr:unnamed protein product [Moneuplotes crassus]